MGNGRYEAAVATFIGLLALVVSAYTAYVQRQQVRAQVLPILQYSSSNEPHLMLTIENKPEDDSGAPLKVGPAGSPGALFNEGRKHIGVEICYCSTLGDCWMLHRDPTQGSTTTAVGRCPARSERTFQQ